MQSRMFVGGITAIEKVGQRRWFTGCSKTHACARKTRPRVVTEFDSQVILTIAELTKLETKLLLVRWSRGGTAHLLSAAWAYFSCRYKEYFTQNTEQFLAMRSIIFYSSIIAMIVIIS